MEQKQFKQDVLPLRGKLLIYAQRILNDTDDAEDVIQEVYLKLWYMRSELASYNSIQALSIQITKHLCLNRIKVRERAQDGLETVWLKSEEPEPDALLEQKDAMAHVMRIIDQLPNLQQAILKMKHIEGLEVEEIAGITGCKPEAVRMNLSRARKKVKELFFKMQL